MPHAFSLENHPNPFNPMTTIKYSIAGGGVVADPVKLAIYDVLGREVSVLVNEAKASGVDNSPFLC